MTINPNDPWYPTGAPSGHSHMPCQRDPGVTIRLHLAAMAMEGELTGHSLTPDMVTDRAFATADALIERANRDEHTDTIEDHGHIEFKDEE